MFSSEFLVVECAGSLESLKIQGEAILVYGPFQRLGRAICTITTLDKVHIVLEGHKIMRNLQKLFNWQHLGQITGGDFANLSALSA